MSYFEKSHFLGRIFQPYGTGKHVIAPLVEEGLMTALIITLMINIPPFTQKSLHSSFYQTTCSPSDVSSVIVVSFCCI